jgi:Protein of unknown function (DUF3761)
MLEKLRGLGLAGLVGLLWLSLVVPGVAQAAPSWQDDPASEGDGIVPVAVADSPSSPVSNGPVVSTGGLVSSGSTADQCGSLTNGRTYTNVDGNVIQSPTNCTTGAVPSGSTALCRDGSYSQSQHAQGTCSGHGGVGQWMQPAPSNSTTPPMTRPSTGCGSRGGSGVRGANGRCQ